MPSASFTAAFLLALVPGWTYLRLRSSRSATLPRAGLDELLEVVSVGTATTGMALALWTLVPARWSHLADVAALSGNLGQTYVAAHTRRVIATALSVFVLAELLAYLLFRLGHRGTRRRLVRETVWAGALGQRGDRFTLVGVQLRDGRLVEGQLLAYPTGDEHEHRDIALQKPLYLTAGGSERRKLGFDRIILNEQEIDHITVALAPSGRGPDRPTAGGRRERVLDRLYRALSASADPPPSTGP